MSCSVAVVTATLFTTSATQNGTPVIRQLSLDVVSTSSIVESPATVGISDNLYLLNNNADIDKTLDMMLSLGVTNVRMDIPWAFIQPSSATSYSWTKMDYIVNAAASRGMNVLGILDATPSWAGSLLTGHPDPTAYAKFASTVAGRYGTKIAAYEIWNEPNASFSYNPVDAASYTELLKAAYTAIKTATGGKAEVVGGVVGAGLTHGTMTVNPVDFITQMYAAGAHGYFDALSIHPYNLNLKFSQGQAGAPGISALDQIIKIKALMATNGDAADKIWISEYGEPTSVVNQATQSAYLTDLINYWQTFSGAGPIFLYNTRDTNADPNYDILNNNFGLFTYDWTPKLAAAAVKALIATLKPITSGVPPVVKPVLNPIAALVAAFQSAFSGFLGGFATSVQKFMASLASIFTPKPKTTVAAVAPKAVAAVAPKTTTKNSSTHVTAAATAAVPQVDPPVKAKAPKGKSANKNNRHPAASAGASNGSPKTDATDHARRGGKHHSADSSGTSNSSAHPAAAA